MADDTEAVRRALKSGKKTILFTRPLYRFEGVLDVPGCVRTIDLLHAAVFITKARHAAVFRIGEEGGDLFVRRAYFVGGTLLDHVAPRRVICEDIYCEFPHIQETHAGAPNNSLPLTADPKSGIWEIYCNATPETRKTLFACNVIGLVADEPMVNVKLEARLVDTEHLPVACWQFKDCDVRMIGEKSENTPIFLIAENSRVVLHGACVLTWDESRVKKGLPTALLRDCTADMRLGCFNEYTSDLMVRDIHGGVTNDYFKAGFRKTGRNACLIDCTWQTPLVDAVDPFIGAVTYPEDWKGFGTANGHGFGKTFPGAATPFGGVQLSPDTITGGDNGPGYSYAHKTIQGFSMLHLSGIGWYGEFGNFLIMPTTGARQFDRDAAASPFDHAEESAAAGYYRVRLGRYDVVSELTVSPHCGFLRFTYPAGEPARVQVDLKRRIGEKDKHRRCTPRTCTFVGDRCVEGTIVCDARDGGRGAGLGHVNYTVHYAAVLRYMHEIAAYCIVYAINVGYLS